MKKRFVINLILVCIIIWASEMILLAKMEYGADSLTLNYQLMEAVCQGDVSPVPGLVEKGADVNFMDRNGKTPLHYAAEYDYPDVVKELLSLGADIHRQDKNGKTPTDICIGQGKTMRILLSHGGRVSIHELTNVMFRKEWNFLVFILLNSRDIHLRIFLPTLIMVGLLFYIIFRTRKKRVE